MAAGVKFLFYSSVCSASAAKATFSVSFRAAFVVPGGFRNAGEMFVTQGFQDFIIHGFKQNVLERFLPRSAFPLNTNVEIWTMETTFTKQTNKKNPKSIFLFKCSVSLRH